HILRHTFCSHLVMRGAAMRSVQELVGHQDLTMIQRYSHLSPAALIDTVRLLEPRAVDSERGAILEPAGGRDRKLKSWNGLVGWAAGVRPPIPRAGAPFPPVGRPPNRGLGLSEALRARPSRRGRTPKYIAPPARAPAPDRRARRPRTGGG